MIKNKTIIKKSISYKGYKINIMGSKTGKITFLSIDSPKKKAIAVSLDASVKEINSYKKEIDNLIK